MAQKDWDSFETSKDFVTIPILQDKFKCTEIKDSFDTWVLSSQELISRFKDLEEFNNKIFIADYGLQSEIDPNVPLSEITLTCNPKYRYGGDNTEEELEALLQTDTIKELISYAIWLYDGTL